MKALNNFLFGGAGATTRFGDLGLLIQRLGFGLAISIGHGMSKVYHDGLMNFGGKGKGRKGKGGEA